MKKLVYVSNRNNIHQESLACEFRKIFGDDYTYVAMTPSFDGKAVRDQNYEPYVLRAFESPEAMSAAQALIDEAECVIVGGKTQYISTVKNRLNQGKMTFLYSERFFKGPFWKDAARFLNYSRYFGVRSYAHAKHAKFFLLCASAFAAWDYNTCGLFRNKAYRWGYFPEPRKYDDIDGLISRKKKASILWAGRFLDWKHTDLAVRLAANLRDMSLDFSMKIIGSGVMQEKLAGMIESLGLSGIVELTGRIPTEELRAEMENSQIFLFTSDRGEGWGAVLNESMNSGCAVVAGEKIGSVPYLIKDGHNGLVFRDRDIDDLTAKVAGLLRNPERMDELGCNAYETMTEIWTPRNAAERFVRLAEALRNSDEPVSLWEDGPGSIAPVI